MKSPHFPIDPRTAKGETQNRTVSTYSSNVEAFSTEPELEKKRRSPQKTRRSASENRLHQRTVRDTWAICTRIAGKLYKARSRLYRSQILQVNTRWKALAEIYTMHPFTPFSYLNVFEFCVLLNLFSNFAKSLRTFSESLLNLLNLLNFTNLAIFFFGKI